ncbi:MAG: hypothetical protein RJA44_1275, partial [Pseudomonadota bacterium]
KAYYPDRNNQREDALVMRRAVLPSDGDLRALD